MEFHQRKLKEVNELYTRHETTIEKLSAAVRREIPLLAQEHGLNLSQVKALEAFSNDKLTLFRYLRKNNFSLPTALSLLLDTMQWRLKERVDELDLAHVQDLLSSPLCFFRHQDKCGRPVLVLQLSFFPSSFRDNTELIETIMPMIIFVLETTRKLLLDLTEQRIAQKLPNPITADLTILVDFKNANSLPKDFTLVQTMIKLLKRYPGMAGMVCLLNFGWMYQGMWQMIKMILSQEAKNRVAFPKLKELKTIIDESNLLLEFGGKDGVQWDIKRDKIFTRYQQKSYDDVSNEKPVSSRRNSTGSLYFDTADDNTSTAPPPYQQQQQDISKPKNEEGVLMLSSHSVYATPTGSLSPRSPIDENSISTHLTNNTRIDSSNHQRNPGSALRSGIQKLLGHDQHRSNGISSFALTQRLSQLQQQQQQQQQQGHHSSTIKSWIISLFKLILSMERNIIEFIMNHRLWIYGFTLLWVLRNGFHRLPLHHPIRLLLVNGSYQPQSIGFWLLSQISSRRRHRFLSN